MSRKMDAYAPMIDMDAIVELSHLLISYPSRNPPGEEEACAEFIYRTLVNWGIEAKLIREPYPERPQVVAWVRGSSDKPTLTLNGHIDTVPEGDASKWRFPPFDAVVAEGNLYGLGSADMKSQLAIAMLILKAFHAAKGALKGTLMFQAVMGEELAEPGTRHLLTQMRLTSDFAIVMEPTKLRIAPATRGVVWHRVTISGVEQHCGLVDHYVNPIAKLAAFMPSLEAYHSRIHEQTHALLRSPAAAVTEVRAGDKHNHIAGSCEFVIDRRMLPGDSSAQVYAELKTILDEMTSVDPDFHYQIEYMRENEPAEISSDHPLVTTLRAKAAAVLGRDPGIWGPPYGSDVRNFIVDNHIPAVNFGPGDFEICHSPHEHVSLEELDQFARILVAVVLDLLM